MLCGALKFFNVVKRIIKRENSDKNRANANGSENIYANIAKCMSN